MKETDLYPPIKRFLELQGYEVKAEVKDCDVVAVRAKEALVIVEIKIGFTLQLVLQGIDRLAISETVYLAIAEPRRRVRAGLVKLCRRLGLGLITVRGPNVEALADPVPYQPRRATKRRAQLLKEFSQRSGDSNSGGSTRLPLMTAYRQDALRCARHIGENGPAKVSAIRQATKVDRTGTILLSDVYGWFEREARGIYALSAKGRAALVTFASVLKQL